MKVILFGASGMIGQGVLRECLLDPDVELALAVGRTPLPQKHEKLRGLVVPDLADLSPFASQLSGFDACFYSLGATAAGSTEENYRRINHDFPLAAATLLAKLNTQMTFIYTDSTEKGRVKPALFLFETDN